MRLLSIGVPTCCSNGPEPIKIIKVKQKNQFFININDNSLEMIGYIVKFAKALFVFLFSYYSISQYILLNKIFENFNYFKIIK